MLWSLHTLVKYILHTHTHTHLITSFSTSLRADHTCRHSDHSSFPRTASSPTLMCHRASHDTCRAKSSTTALPSGQSMLLTYGLQLWPRGALIIKWCFGTVHESSREPINSSSYGRRNDRSPQGTSMLGEAPSSGAVSFNHAQVAWCVSPRPGNHLLRTNVCTLGCHAGLVNSVAATLVAKMRMRALTTSAAKRGRGEGKYVHDL